MDLDCVYLGKAPRSFINSERRAREKAADAMLTLEERRLRWPGWRGWAWTIPCLLFSCVENTRDRTFASVVLVSEWALSSTWINLPRRGRILLYPQIEKLIMSKEFRESKSKSTMLFSASYSMHQSAIRVSNIVLLSLSSYSSFTILAFS